MTNVGHVLRGNSLDVKVNYRGGMNAEKIRSGRMLQNNDKDNTIL